MRFLDELDIEGKKLIMRVDFNVPLDGGRITDDNRIAATVPTLKFCLDRGAAVVVCCHMGNPKGKADPALSLTPVAGRLGELLNMEVKLAPDCVGPERDAMVGALAPGGVLLLENTRFHAAETSKDETERMAFAEKLVAGTDLYVNDAFGVAHRKNASVTEAPLAAPDCCMGLLMRREWEYLNKAVTDPAKPYVAVSGGAKVSTKLGILHHLLGLVDDIIICGAMANTFLLAMGKDMASSLVEPDLVESAKAIMAEAEEKGTSLHLPSDVVYAEGPKADKAAGVCAAGYIPAGMMALDIGPETLAEFGKVLAKAATVVWNGPAGAFENKAFAGGSLALAEAMASLDALTIVGGGDTDVVVHDAGLADKFSFISTGGGSFLEFLKGEELPAFKALKECAE